MAKVKIAEIGQPCRHCETPVERREHKTPPKYKAERGAVVMTPLELAKGIVAGGPESFERLVEIRREAFLVAQALIRREEGVEVTRYSPGSWQCVACKSLFSNAPNYCDDCGARLKWPSLD
jgi:hypothetical protein